MYLKDSVVQKANHLNYRQNLPLKLPDSRITDEPVADTPAKRKSVNNVVISSSVT